MSALLTLIRVLIAFGGGFLVRDGSISASDVTEIGGAVITLVPLAWGAYKNFHKNEQLIKVQEGMTVDQAKASTPLLAK